MTADPQSEIRNLQSVTLALLIWFLNLDGSQPDCYDLCWRDYTGERPDERVAICRTLQPEGRDGCPFGQVLRLYPPETVQRAVGSPHTVDSPQLPLFAGENDEAGDE